MLFSIHGWTSWQGWSLKYSTWRFWKAALFDVWTNQIKPKPMKQYSVAWSTKKYTIQCHIIRRLYWLRLFFTDCVAPDDLIFCAVPLRDENSTIKYSNSALVTRIPNIFECLSTLSASYIYSNNPVRWVGVMTHFTDEETAVRVSNFSMSHTFGSIRAG